MAFELETEPVAPQAEPEKNNDTSAFDSGTKLQMKPLGSSGTELFSGYFSEEYLQNLRGRKGAKVWDEIRRSESQVAMLLNAVMNPIKAGTWEFEAPAIPDGEKHKDFINYNAKECIDWETHLHEALTLLAFGYSVFEIIHAAVFNNPKFGTFTGLKALAFRSQKTIERWNVERETGELRSVTQFVHGDLTPSNNGFAGQYDMLAEFLLIFSLQKEGDNYEGISALRPMYGPWFRKNLYLKIAGIGVEKNAIGTPIGKIPSGKQTDDQVNAFKEMLSNFTAHEAAFIMAPAGWEVDVIKNDFDASKIKDLILMENTEMINCLVANFLALGTNGGGGAYALGSDLSDFFLTGIQNYANIICGVWNRKLIPNLIKLNFGPQAAYPTLKATGINDKAGKELAEILASLLGAKALTADMKLEEYLRKAYNLPKPDVSTVREQDPIAPAATETYAPTPVQLSELQLGEKKSYKAQWNDDKAGVKEVMQKGMADLLTDYKNQISRLYKGATPSARQSIGLKIQPKTTAYEKDLRETLAQIASRSVEGAKKETPKAKNVKLHERFKLAAPKGGYFDALPNNIKRLVKTQAGLIAGTQAADLEKVVTFQYTSSQSSTDNLDQILTDIDAAALPVIDGSTAKGLSVDAAAGNAVSSVVNQARLEWFFEPEVLDTIESFTFVNEDPVSEICQELDGTTWAVNDPDLDRYSPPLHHNCKSRLMPNEKGADKNPEINRQGTAVSEKALKSITLCDCTDYHLQLLDSTAGK